MKLTGSHKTCKVCGQSKPIEEFRMVRPDYRDTFCIPCKREYCKLKARKHKQKVGVKAVDGKDYDFVFNPNIFYG